MEKIVWHDRYKIGVDLIDKEHKQLFSTMDKLLKLSENEEKSEWVCREGIKYLKNHAIQHFEHEEEYMRSIDYKDYKIHKRLHDNFSLQTLPALEKEMAESNYSEDSIRHFLGVCIGWVVAHTQTEDQAITGKTTSKWGNLPQLEEKEALEKTIIQLVYDIFHIKAKLLSEHYEGENFGKMICCRFVYRGREKGTWEITLVFEEKLLLKTIAIILKEEYPRVDDMVINVTRYISRQFIEQLGEAFSTLDLFELEKENLLTYEQLVNSYERVHPPYSMLFGAEEGYFAFSAVSSESVQGAFLMEINPENAMSTIKEYLEQERPAQKKKILVVDDSDFMRGRIIKLLGEDYEVIEAGSSLTAIQKITVNRPDLVLLDYEMPVCDGRQALHMIRSEKEIANIPVIFLTGRGDRESVSKVMELKPEGYFLKTLPDGEIKKNIDDFFVKRG